MSHQSRVTGIRLAAIACALCAVLIGLAPRAVNAAQDRSTDASDTIRPPAPGRVPVEDISTPLPTRIYYWPSVTETLAYVLREVRTPRGQRFLKELLPSQSGILLIAVLVMLVTIVDWTSWPGTTGWDVLLITLVPATLYGAVWFFHRLHVPGYVGLLDWVFVANATLTALLLARTLVHAKGPRRPIRSSLPTAALIALALLMVSLNVASLVLRDPDDSSYFVALGAQRTRERLRLPYGDPLLTETPGAAYGPVLYVTQAAVQTAVGARLNSLSPGRPVLGEHSLYYAPPVTSTRVFLLIGHLLGVVLLWKLVRAADGIPLAWALVAVYAANPFVMGLGGSPLEDQVCGVSYASHVWPPLFVLVALWTLPRATASGLWLALAAGAGFYPLALVPAWCGFYWRNTHALRRFLVSFACVGAVVAGGVWLFSSPVGDMGRAATFMRDTVGHHTDPLGYGRSAFGLWGQRGGLRAWGRGPLIDGHALSSPMMLAWVLVSVLAGFLARGASRRQLALLAAAVSMAATLVKIHATGTYGMWWLALWVYGRFSSGDD